MLIVYYIIGTVLYFAVKGQEVSEYDEYYASSQLKGIAKLWDSSQGFVYFIVWVILLICLYKLQLIIN